MKENFWHGCPLVCCRCCHHRLFSKFPKMMQSRFRLRRSLRRLPPFNHKWKGGGPTGNLTSLLLPRLWESFGLLVVVVPISFFFRLRRLRFRFPFERILFCFFLDEPLASITWKAGGLGADGGLTMKLLGGDGGPGRFGGEGGLTTPPTGGLGGPGGRVGLVVGLVGLVVGLVGLVVGLVVGCCSRFEGVCRRAVHPFQA